MKFKKIVFFVFLVCTSFSLKATNYYINAAIGDDANKGTSPTNSWKTVSPVKLIQLNPGDSILFATGQSFTGMLSLIDVKGVAHHPVVVTSYLYKGNKAKPVLDAGEELNALLIQNSSFIQVSGIEFTGVLPYQKNGTANKAEMRCGILVEVTKDETFEHIRLNDVVVHDVYYNPKGFTRSAAEIKTANGTQSYGWGIRVINNTKTGRLRCLKILKCEVFNVSHTGIKATGNVNSIQQLEVAECKVYQTGAICIITRWIIRVQRPTGGTGAEGVVCGHGVAVTL